MVKCTKVELTCPDCPSSTPIIEDTKSGYNICSSCGCTIGPRLIDEGSEWRSFSSDGGSDPSRVGAFSNPLLDCEQLDTLISTTGSYASHSLARTQMKSVMRGPERALLNGFSLVNTYCDRACIPQTVADQSKMIYKTVLEKKLTRGKNTEAVIAACLHLACKHLKCARTFKEMSLICQIPKEEIGKAYKLIEKHFDRTKIVSTDDIVERFCSHLSLGIAEQKMAVKISKRAIELGCVAGKSPVSVAAAVIYMVSLLFGRKKIQREICYVTKVSEVTVKNTYKEMVAFRRELVLEDEFPSSVIDGLPNT